MTLPFIRPDLAHLTAYTPHPGTATDAPVQLDPLDTNECPYDLPQPLKAKLAWLGEHELRSNRYPDGGHLALKTEIAHYVSETVDGAAGSGSSPFTADWITVGNGSDELIRSILIATCLGGQGSILVAQPTFSMYAILARTLGIEVITIDRDTTSFELNLTVAQQVLDHPPAAPVRVVFMVHPNSPTANPLTPSELAWLQHLPEQVLVVVDEAYFEFSQHTTAATAQQRTNWIVLRTFSKAFRLAAYRVGYAVANPTLTMTLDKVRLPYNLPSISQAAASLALAHRQELLAVVPEIQAQRAYLQQQIGQIPGLKVWPSAANFLYVRPPAHQEDRSIVLTSWFTRLKQQGTLIRLTGDGLRITVGSPEENQRTVEHLQLVARS